MSYSSDASEFLTQGAFKTVHQLEGHLTHHDYTSSGLGQVHAQPVAVECMFQKLKAHKKKSVDPPLFVGGASESFVGGRFSPLDESVKLLVEANLLYFVTSLMASSYSFIARCERTICLSRFVDVVRVPLPQRHWGMVMFLMHFVVFHPNIKCNGFCQWAGLSAIVSI